MGRPAQLDGEQLGPRVEADDELAPFPFDELGEPVGKRRGHGGARLLGPRGHESKAR
jgi:hypothetical protein